MLIVSNWCSTLVCKFVVIIINLSMLDINYLF